MAGNRRIRPPSGLNGPGRKLWREITDSIDLDAAALRVLGDCCRTADAIDGLQAILDAEGLAAVGGRKVNPVLVELRQQRALLSRLLSQLPGEAGQTLETPATVRARRAARARWDRRLRVVESSAPRVSRYEHLKTQPPPSA